MKIPISLLWEKLDEKEKASICKKSKVSTKDAKEAFTKIPKADQDKIYEDYYGKELAKIIIKAGGDVRPEKVKKEEA